MNTAEMRHSPLRRQLDAYAESWKSDHLAAQDCFDLEEEIAVGLSLASLVDQVEASWREWVFRSDRFPSDEEVAVARTSLQLWLFVSDRILSSATEMERTYGTVNGLIKLREAVTKARTRLATWSPPKPAAAVGLRDQTLSLGEAKELDTLLGRPAPPAPQRSFEVKDSSFLQ